MTVEPGGRARSHRWRTSAAFGGHSRVFYSVAQHCVIVSRVVEERGGDVEPLDLELTAWSPDQAADEFAKRYAELDARR